MKQRLLMLASVFVLTLFFVAQAAAETITVRGRLGRTVEAGGWLILTEKQKYLILNSKQFQNETWFRETVEVEATGETKPGTITIYQEGVPFQVRTMRPVSDDRATATTRIPESARVLVSGDATIQAQPDTAIVMIAVVTQSRNALEAQQENANKSDTVIRAVKVAAGAGAEVKTSGYILQPQYAYRENQPPTIRGYEARNIVTVTISDLSKVGATIDAASGAGANNVDNLSFTLRKDRPAREQALTEATREALSKAQAIAQALSGRVVRIVEVREESAARPPIPLEFSRAATVGVRENIQTPVEVGSLEIKSQVQVVVEIETKP